MLGNWLKSKLRNRWPHRNSTMTHLQMSTTSVWEIESMRTYQQRKLGLLTIPCPFVGPYRVLKLYDTVIDVRLISKPFAKPIWVALGRVRLCPAEIPDQFQLPTSDTNTNNGTKDVEVCAVDENAEKLEQNGEDNREAPGSWSV